ncbi:RNA methyltransferase [Kaistia algarum]|uniref:TrmH family RNA methyltransferase n=1 Tax=Kaistia algarum TaxID=2083279 RepID=UPI000CE88F3C|nr:RNA methyltransferase [Kaistia algarum]MCX5516674.1 RNA methyltransferase [Kaistia algarum]PPE78575.1 RNA methyltransferase [Kaistia algarum]
MADDSPIAAPGAVRSVTSLSNPTIKEIRSLALPKYRKESGLFVTEGMKLVADAVEEDWPIKILVYGAKVASHPVVRRVAVRAHARGGEVLEVSDAVLSKMTRRDNPQMVVGVFEQRLTPAASIRPSPRGVWVALEGIKDPGNLGTIIRTVDAVGAEGVILVGDTVDPFGIEAVRATMGSIFHVPLARLSVAEFAAWRKNWPGIVVGTHLSGQEDYREVPYDRPVLLLMGNEQSGIDDSFAALCDHLVKIPQAGRADSLNLAIATGVMLFEIRRTELKLA